MKSKSILIMMLMGVVILLSTNSFAQTADTSSAQTPEQVIAKEKLDKQRISEAQSLKQSTKNSADIARASAKEAKEKSKEANRIQKEAADAEKQAKRALKAEAKAQKARDKADNQARKAANANTKSENN